VFGVSVRGVKMAMKLALGMPVDVSRSEGVLGPPGVSSSLVNAWGVQLCSTDVQYSKCNTL
jgi:hypothetical protein